MRILHFIRSLGPGLLYAGAAIGVSHLVQSTRAGASYGFDLVLILILANVLKYPFFEFGPRYASATGSDLIEGYRKIGKWAIILFAVLTFSTVFAIQAAITVVTAGLTSNLLGFPIDHVTLSLIILIVVMVVLIIGHYSILDRLIKYIIVILALSTVTAVAYALFKGGPAQGFSSGHFSVTRAADIMFLIAFIGWMPAPIDVSVWHSLWTNAKKEMLSEKISIKQSLVDFKIGYWGTAFLALCFLTLGALVMNGSGEDLSPDGVTFAGQLINLYTSTIGSWAYFIISIAALSTMFSTTMTCLDAYPRVIQPTAENIWSSLKTKNSLRQYIIWMILVITGTTALIKISGSTMIWMVDLATTLSFITAPVLAFLNYKVVTSKHMPEEAVPGRFLRIYSWIGIIFLGLFSIVFLTWRFVL